MSPRPIWHGCGTETCCRVAYGDQDQGGAVFSIRRGPKTARQPWIERALQRRIEQADPEQAGGLSLPAEVQGEALRLLQAGNRLEAIRVIRVAGNYGLADATKIAAGLHARTGYEDISPKPLELWRAVLMLSALWGVATVAFWGVEQLKGTPVSWAFSGVFFAFALVLTIIIGFRNERRKQKRRNNVR